MRRRTVFVIFSVVALLQLTMARDAWAQAMPGEKLAFENGDSNGDLKLDLSDGIHLLSFLYGGGPAPAPLACGGLTTSLHGGDANADRSVDITDAIYLFRHLFQGGPPPADVFCIGEGPGGAGAVHRPIADFLSTQGTFCQDVLGDGSCFLFVPPSPNFLGWSNDIDTNNDGVQDKPLLFSGVDYAALANEHFGNLFGTEVSGSILERSLADGRALVEVVLHTKSANGWVIALDLSGDVLAQVADGATLFGYRPEDVAAGADPALGSTSLRVVFVNTAPGAPLPDLLQLSNAPEEGQELRTLAFLALLSGPLTAEFGVPEGTPGRCTIQQNGVLTAGNSGHLVGADGFPAEFINLKPIGK